MKISMQWYNFDTLAVDRFVQTLALTAGGLGINADPRPHRDSTYQLIQGGQFLVAQCCGLDLIRQFNHIQPLVVPVYDNGSAPGWYCSYLVCRPEAAERPLDQLRWTANYDTSWSGYFAGLVWLRDQGLDPKVLAQAPRSGGHRASLEALLAGETDAAFVDSVTFSLLRQPMALDRRLHVRAKTAQVPSCPLVVPSGMDPQVKDQLRALFRQPMSSQLGRAAMATGITAFVDMPLALWQSHQGKMMRDKGLW